MEEALSLSEKYSHKVMYAMDRNSNDESKKEEILRGEGSRKLQEDDEPIIVLDLSADEER